MRHMNHTAGIAGIVISGLLASVAAADVISVPGDQPTIQDAIDAAVDGDEILIAPGTYNQGFIMTLVDKAITLRGSGGAAVTVLEGPLPTLEIIQLVNVEADTIIDGLTFTNAGFLPNGGIVELAVAGPTIQNCIFSNNTASAIGGNAVAGLTISNCQFIDNNDSQQRGGAIDVSGADATVSGCTFTNNSTTSGGGAVAVGGGPWIFSSCSFEGNTTTVDNDSYGGGAVYVQPSGDADFDACTFTGNMTVDTGGAIDATNDADLTLTNCSLTGNTAAADGGAVRAVAAASVTITDCTFDGNESTGGDGGAAWLEATAASLSGCPFTTNTAGNGGGLVLNGVDVLDCTFDGNMAAGNGGGLLGQGGSSTATNCFASNNVAGGSGGGMYIAADATVTVVDSTFCQNTTDDLAWDGLLIAQHVVSGLGGDECDQTLAQLGACCLPTDGCALTTETSCSAAGGVYQGNGVSCGAAACPLPCVADLDGNGTVGIGDFLLLLAAWGVCP
jgi:hypothetical protein